MSDSWLIFPLHISSRGYSLQSTFFDSEVN
jgi:hypothetical protein